MTEIFEQIRTHFNVVLTDQELTLTLINPNISGQLMQQILNLLNQLNNLKKLDVTIIQCPNFDDQLLTILARAIPQTVQQLSLDFTGCQSLRGEGFLQLFENIDGLPLTKLSLDCGSVYDINDIVIQGLVLLLSNLSNLKQFYLDLYEVDQITENGYLLLAQSLSEMEYLTKLHIDLSANPNLEEDALQILFSGNYKNLTYFSFKIIDIEHIGGGSFFKFGESIARMTLLKQLNLTISTFTQLNQKGIYSVFKSIGKLTNVNKMDLNFSNINISEKVITYLNFSPKLTDISLDISCNRLISFGDFVNLSTKLKKISKIKLNIDFCSGINQQTVQSLIDMIGSQNICTSLILNDRNYSIQFQNYVIDKLWNVQSLIRAEINSSKISKKMKIYEAFLSQKRTFLAVCLTAGARQLPQQLTKPTLQQLFHCP